MTKKCIVCKLEPNPVMNYSFHKFPSSDRGKQKWMSALQLTKTPNFKTTFVCGNHFHEDDFFPESENRQRPRLLPDAVPTIHLPSINHMKPNVAIFHPTVIIKEEVPCSFEDSESNVPGIGDSIPIEFIGDDNSPTDLNSKADTDDPDADITIKSENSNIKKFSNGKRKIQSNEVHPTKRIRLTDGVRTELFSRQDFSSDASWKRFVGIIEAKRRKATARKRSETKRKKKVKLIK